MKLFKIRNILSLPSLLNITGIAVAVAAFYVIMSVVDFDLTFNHGVKDCEKVYALSFGWQEGKRDSFGGELRMSQSLGRLVAVYQTRRHIPSARHPHGSYQHGTNEHVWL